MYFKSEISHICPFLVSIIFQEWTLEILGLSPILTMDGSRYTLYVVVQAIVPYLMAFNERNSDNYCFVDENMGLTLLLYC